MTRTSQDFSTIDPGETKFLSHGYGAPGQAGSDLATGETIISVVFQISVISGVDPSPSSRLIGAGFVQPSGIIVTQKVGSCLAGVVYELLSTATTSTGQTLIRYTHFLCASIT